MADKDRLDLVRNLSAVYNECWGDEAGRNRLAAEPRAVLAEHGIQLPATVTVEAELVDDPPDAPQGTLDDFLAEWDSMVEQGTVELKVPARPAGVATRVLTDEELEGTSGGFCVDAGGSTCWAGGT